MIDSETPTIVESPLGALDLDVAALTLLGARNPHADPWRHTDDVSGFVAYWGECLGELPNFEAYELVESPRGPLLPDRVYWARGCVLALIAQRCRDAADSAVTLRWWFRPPPINHGPGGVGGAAPTATSPGSDHLTASAVDLVYQSRAAIDRAVEDVLLPLYRGGLLEVSLGYGRRTTHVGVFSPGGRRRWVYPGVDWRW